MINPFRVEIDPKEKSSESLLLEKKLSSFDPNIEINISKVYSLDYGFSQEELEKISSSLHNPIVENFRINNPKKSEFDWALELGFLPGVTDNVSHTVTEIIEDLLNKKIGFDKVFSSKLIFIKSKVLTKEKVEEIARDLINVLIERFHIKSYQNYILDNGMDFVVPKVHLTENPTAIEVNLNVSDEELIELGKKGILDPITGENRGPLALSLDFLKSIQKYFKQEGRNPTDIELESIAQTWSEHCKHTIFAGEMDEIKEGIYKRYIKNATEQIRQKLGDKDFCVSVFKDNSGAIIFDDKYLITDKAETHNSPSALDPFGGAITGIVGVNRDTIGFGKGALPIANKYGFCLGFPEDKRIVYRGKNKTNPALSPKKIMEGVIEGVNVGGNCSGIPTPTGFLYFDDCYRGKPLIFVGTIGLIPKKLSDNSDSCEKQAQNKDNIVVIGGRVGKDGIHGATFSSEEMDEGSPATAVQIGDPITQKKLSDAIIKEARDKGLYTSITDNGAGGLSCSVAEMAKECGGFIVDLEKVQLKYPGLQPWETWISESQERMTLAVSDENLEEFNNLMKERGVESTVIGKFNSSGRGIINFNGKEIFNLDMEFLHEGLPISMFNTIPYNYNTYEPNLIVENQRELFLKILDSHNNCGFEFLSQQYDHEVQASSVIKPLQGKGKVNGTASVIKPLTESSKGVVMTQVILPRLSNINTYDMAACTIDTAIRNAVAAGANINHMALMDNFCWCSSNEPQRLAQLKDAAKACFDYSTSYQTPFISGKDSMFNDFKGYDESDSPVKISVNPTLMISTISVINETRNTQTIDFKCKGDLIYVIGNTKDECGASEFYHSHNELGSKAPKVNSIEARKLYETIYNLHQKNIISSCYSVEKAGLGIGFAKSCIAGKLGARIDLQKIPLTESLPTEKILYSESQSRFIVSIDPKNKEEFENALQEFTLSLVGEVSSDKLMINKGEEKIMEFNLQELDEIYKRRFKDF